MTESLFPLPSDGPSVHWHFDRGVEALVLVERSFVSGKSQMNVSAWPRRVWESARFSLEGLRTMPAAPPNIHAALLAEPTRWR